jgi:hypothetical protein
VETTAGEPLISTRPFAGTKWSAWLVSKESPRLSGSKHSYTKNLLQYLTAPLPSSPYRQHTKTLGLQKPSVSNIMGRRNKRAGMPAYSQVGSATGGQ